MDTGDSRMMQDVIVVGAGLGGLCVLHHLLEAGFAASCIEAGAGVGGTWYWNRYPGARCDTPSLEYSFGFSDELQQEWHWSEFFAAQPEIERYLNHVTDRFDLRRHITFDTKVVTARLDESDWKWTLTTDDGRRWIAPFVVMATGCLSAPALPDYSGMDTFVGLSLQTSSWPGEVDLARKRIGVIGTGSSAVQAIPELAKVAGHLHVFQRTATFTYPSHNGPMDPAVEEAAKARYPELRRLERTLSNGIAGFGGAPMFQPPRPVNILESTAEERAAVLGELGWGACRAWSDISTNAQANEMAVELYREMVRRTVTDRLAAEALSPYGYPLGCKRPVLDTGYFEAFNRPNVTIVDLRSDGIQAITESGIRTSSSDIDLDVIVFATGFDAMTGALDRVDIRGRGGRSLRDEWASEGVKSLLGLQLAGYPNLFTVNGPGSPSVVANMATTIEHHAEWITACLLHLREKGLSAIEPTTAAQDAWADRVNEIASKTMYTAPTCNSWYLGTNIPGKRRQFLPFVGGLSSYIAICDDIAREEYRGFHRT